jgi:hypothetical protein
MMAARLVELAANSGPTLSLGGVAFFLVIVVLLGGLVLWYAADALL